ncbi:lysophospholipid acyltransferase family protein [Lichenihabitans psoromatis]|uniref:lysophospholipid acyltransferase family protein n=1 Tax=Lichenihabitans psoromatis TaxID=2528642 RepID=UPI00103691DD|nr:hypothetical protein [Lichenihabitans psoromatis]
MNTADRIDWTLHLAMSKMPISLCSSLGARLGFAMGKRKHPLEHQRAVALFRRLRPDLAADPGAYDAMADRLWANIGRTFAEFAVSHRILRSGRVTIDNRDRLDATLSAGRPIVAIFPHLGNWELTEMQIGFYAPHRGAVIVAPPASAARAAIAHRVRSQAPAELLPTSRTVWRKAMERLRRPDGILMVAVDDYANGRVGAPAFGAPPRLDGNLAKAVRLAMMHDAIIMPFHNERVAGSRFMTRILPTFMLDGSADDAGAVLAGIQQIDAVMTEPILRLLDQWYMAISYPQPTPS